MFNYSIRNKLTATFLILGLLPVGAVMPIMWNELHKMQQSHTDDMKNTAATIGNLIDRSLFERYGDVQALGTNAAAKSRQNWYSRGSDNPLIASMNASMTHYGLYKIMMLVDMDGKVAAVNEVDSKGKALNTTALYSQSFKDAGWFQKAVRKEFLRGEGLDGSVVEPPRYETIVADSYKGEDGYTIPFAAPVYDYSGAMIGVWVNFADFGLVENIVKDVYRQQTEIGMKDIAFAVGDNKGTILVNYDPVARKEAENRRPDVIGKKTLADMKIPAAAAAVREAAGSTSERDTVSGREDAVSWSKTAGALGFPGLGWTVVMYQPGEHAFADVVSARRLLLIAVAGALAIVTGAGVLIGTLASRPLRNSTRSIQAIAGGDYTIRVDDTGRSDEIGSLAKAMHELKTTLDTNTRIRQALDTVSSNVMMADENFNIIYMNDPLKRFLKEAEDDLKKDLPRFSTASLIGTNIDVFHKNPAHQRGMLDRLSEPAKSSILVGGRAFNLYLAPLFNQNKKRIGTVVEWVDGAAAGIVAAVNRAQAVIEFSLDGTIERANDNFLKAMGYTLDEIKGKHHSMFCPREIASSPEYKKFWADLNQGASQEGEFLRLGKGGAEIWIRANYNPIRDLNGKIIKIVKCSTEITRSKLESLENERGALESMKVLTALSEGDLTQKMEMDYNGTFNNIKTALNATIDRLRDTVLRIKESAESVNSASSEISAGSTDLSQRTEEQASSLEETAASMEELTGTVRQNSENARNANQLSSEAQDVAERGGQVVGEAVSAMNNIEKSSKKISDIISVIDEIAFQTNLLALNAAVEAARAGDAGKGFAVVASEVRSLAGRSATASKEIKALIMESSGQVKTGAELVNSAGTTLKDIVSSVKKVAQIISEISNASTEQSTGIDEINTAVSQMDEMTQQNAALVEQNTAAAQSLVQQAQMLAQLVAFFKVDEKSSSSPAPGFEPVIVKGSKPAPARTRAARPARNPVLADRKIIAAGGANGHGNNGHDREWEEF